MRLLISQLVRNQQVIGSLLLALGLIGWSSAVTGAGPPEPASQPHTPIPTKVPPTETPNPTSTPTEIPPTATTVPTPTRTPAPPGIEITAQQKIKRVMFYRGIIESWITLEPKEYHNITLEDVDLILAIMVAESGGDKDIVSSAGAVGLMQVIPRPFTAVRSRLFEPRVNIYWGIYIYDRAINNADGDKRLALAYYNCGEKGVHENRCGSSGGLTYADKVLTFWLPRVQEAMENDPP